MAYVADKKEILKVLVENLNNNNHPQIVEADDIAKRLNMSQKEICRIIKRMQHVGEVESDQEGRKLLITRQGLSWITSHSTSSMQM